MQIVRLQRRLKYLYTGALQVIYTGWVKNAAPLRCFDVGGLMMYFQKLLSRNRRNPWCLMSIMSGMYHRSHQRTFLGIYLCIVCVSKGV